MSKFSDILRWTKSPDGKMELQAFVEKCGQTGRWEPVPFVEWDKIPIVPMADEQDEQSVVAD